MDLALLDLLVCPACGGDLAALGVPTDQEDLMSGTLRCANGPHHYRVVNGVPRLNSQLEEHQLTNVARTFGFEWRAHHRGDFEDETLFGRTREQDWQMVIDGMSITDATVEGAFVLDAGCGSGRFCQLFADHGAGTVIGVDINEAVDDAALYCMDYPNVHIIQANIFALPFKRELIDLIWCNGVIHHTPDAAGAHRSLSKHVRRGGILYVWVYPKRFNPFRSVKRVFDLAGVSRCPPRALQMLANVMAYPSLMLLWLYRGARSLPPLRPRTAWGRRTVRPRTIRELKLTWFDTISPEFDTRHSEDEVVGWFRREGFGGIKLLEEPKIGVRGVAGGGARGAP
jgi:SAM-dependent methyltransferase/uncharacterized protein YbaR (Trm112 family)